MTTTSWTTTEDVPPSRWAALAADLRTLLGVMAAAGATATNLTADGPPVFTDNTLAVSVQLPDREPLAVEFHRAAGTGTITTSSPLTDGLVLTAMARAQTHWGQVLTYGSDAGTAAHAIRDVIATQLFAAGDRAISGTGGPVLAAQRVWEYAAQAIAAHADTATNLADLLERVVGELTLRRGGVATALALLPRPTPPAPVAPTPEPTPDEGAADVNAAGELP
jgi:hypothetical protein